jgi:hypothetical protein
LKLAEMAFNDMAIIRMYLLARGQKNDVMFVQDDISRSEQTFGQPQLARGVSAANLDQGCRAIQ